MIKIQVNNEMFAYDMYHISKAFCPGVEIEQRVDKECDRAVTIMMADCPSEQTHTTVCEKHFTIHENELSGIKDRKLKKRYVNLKIY